MKFFIERILLLLKNSFFFTSFLFFHTNFCMLAEQDALIWTRGIILDQIPFINNNFYNDMIVSLITFECEKNSARTLAKDRLIAIIQYVEKIAHNTDHQLAKNNSSSHKAKQSLRTIERKIYPNWGFSARQGIRRNMEDTHVVQYPFGEEENYSFFAIYDGHDGKYAAQLSAQILHKKFLHEYLQNKNDSVDNLLLKAFEQTEEELKKGVCYIDHNGIMQHSTDSSGTTAITAFLQNNVLHLAWVGDSRAILIRNGKVFLVTNDHKPDMQSERLRIENAGGKVILDKQKTHRINGLSLSRALGDFREKKMNSGALIATPEILQTEIQDDDILVIACDGLWDVMTNEEIAYLINNLMKENDSALKKKYYFYPNLGLNSYQKYNIKPEKTQEYGNTHMKLISRALRDEAYNKGSLDNISVMVIHFDQAKEDYIKKAIKNQTARFKEKIIKSLTALKECLICKREKNMTVSFINLLNKNGIQDDNLFIIRTKLEELKKSNIEALKKKFPQLLDNHIVGYLNSIEKGKYPLIDTLIILYNLLSKLG